MYSEKFMNYLLRYQSEPRDKTNKKTKKKLSSSEKPHFGFIYAKMMREKYATCANGTHNRSSTNSAYWL